MAARRWLARWRATSRRCSSPARGQALGGAGGLIAVFAILGGGEGPGRRHVGRRGGARHGDRARARRRADRAVLLAGDLRVPGPDRGASRRSQCSSARSRRTSRSPGRRRRSRGARRSPSRWCRPRSARSCSCSSCCSSRAGACRRSRPPRPSSVIPLGAVVGTRVRGDARVRAAVGSALIGAGVLALAWLPDASVAWTFAPAGGGRRRDGDGAHRADRRIAARAHHARRRAHARGAPRRHRRGPARARAGRRPQLDVATEHARERGVALVLDAPIAPAQKLDLAPSLLAGVDAQDPRDGLQRAVAVSATGSRAPSSPPTTGSACAPTRR